MSGLVDPGVGLDGERLDPERERWRNAEPDAALDPITIGDDDLRLRCVLDDKVNDVEVPSFGHALHVGTATLH